MIDFVRASISRHTEKLSEINQRIWSFAETGFQVKKSADLLCETLIQEGFELERGVANISHAFTATFGNGKPLIGILAEYDALSGLSQQAGCPTYNPKEIGGPGHGCGHCALAAGALGAALVVKEYLQDTGHSGTVILFGCPAEENGWAKAFMARAGLFDPLDVALTWHPQMKNFIVDESTLAVMSLKFHFTGISSHAAGAPEQGRSALDACELMNVGVNYLREHVISGARLHYAYLDAGGSAPNVVPDKASLHYFIRAPKTTQALEISERVSNVARGAALMTDTHVNIEVVSGMSNLVLNFTLNEVMREAFDEAGPPVFDERDFKIAADFFKGLPKQHQDEVRATIARQYGETKVADLLQKPLATKIIPYKKPQTIGVSTISTDVGDVSYITPTAQINVATACLGTQLHSWNMTGQMTTSISQKGILKASEVLALAAIKLLHKPNLVEAARRELNEFTGGIYNCPVPDGVHPPKDN